MTTTRSRHGSLALGFTLALAAGCATTRPAVDVRSTLPVRGTAETVIAALSAAVEQKEIGAFALSDDSYFVFTSWHVGDRAGPKIVAARAQVQVDGDGAHVRTERRECSRSQTTCELAGSYAAGGRQMVRTKHYVDKLPEAKDATLFDERTLAARIESLVARR